MISFVALSRVDRDCKTMRKAGSPRSSDPIAPNTAPTSDESAEISVFSEGVPLLSGELARRCNRLGREPTAFAAG